MTIIKFPKYTKALYKLLDKHKTKDRKKITYTSMGYPYGSYAIHGINRKKLLKLYQEALLEGTPLHLTEVHRNRNPILIDIDFNYIDETNTRRYKRKDIKTVIAVYNKFIKKYLKVYDDKMLSFVFEKPNPTHKGENKYKDGWHIMYPEICTTPELQYVLRNNVIQYFKKKNFFSNLNSTDKLEKIFDKAVIIDNNWLLYGSSKPDNKPYELTMIYNSNNEREKINRYLNKYLPSLLSIRKFDKEDLTEYNISQELILEEYKKLGIEKKKQRIKKKIIRGNPDDIRKAEKLVEILSDERADDYNQWIELGFCLHNIDDSLLEEWINFSMKNDKFKLGECQKKWANFRNDGYGLGLGSLYRWAKEDNPDEFRDFEIDELKSYIEASSTGSSYDVARVIYEKYQYVYACADIKNNLWYEFKGHKWIEINQGYTLFKRMNEEIVNDYLEKAEDLMRETRGKRGDQKDDKIKQYQQLANVAVKLRTMPFKEQVMKEAKALFYDPNFINNLNENRYLIGFNNGVFDLKKNQFRDGRPEDYITMSTNNDYIEYDEDDEIVKSVYKLFKDIQPKEEMFNYILDLLTSCLQGHVPDEKFHLWTGNGSNGKSLIINLFELGLGDYASTMSTSLITSKRPPSNAATPEMAKMKGVRFAVFNEPEATDRIYVGNMKLYTGGDKIQARPLYKPPIEYYPQFKMLLACNKLPKIPASDGGTWRRLRVVPFDSKFVDNPKRPNEKKIDRTLKNKLPEWKEGLMSILIHRFPNYLKHGLIEPESVLKYTRQYQENSDIYLEFINEFIVITNNDDDELDEGDAYDEFKNWHREAHSDKRMPSKGDFKLGLKEKLPDKYYIECGYIINARIRDIDERRKEKRKGGNSKKNIAKEKTKKGLLKELGI